MSFSNSVKVALNFIGPNVEFVFFFKDMDFEVATSDFFFDLFTAKEDDSLSDE